MSLSPTSLSLSWAADDEIGKQPLFPVRNRVNPGDSIATRALTIPLVAGTPGITIIGGREKLGVSYETDLGDFSFTGVVTDPLRRWKGWYYTIEVTGPDSFHSSAWGRAEYLMLPDGTWYVKYTNSAGTTTPLSNTTPYDPLDSHTNSVSVDYTGWDGSKTDDSGYTTVESFHLNSEFSDGDREASVDANLTRAPLGARSEDNSVSRTIKDISKSFVSFKNNSDTATVEIFLEKLVYNLKASSTGATPWLTTIAHAASLSSAITYPLIDEFGGFSTLDFRWADVTCYKASDTAPTLVRTNGGADILGSLLVLRVIDALDFSLLTADIKVARYVGGTPTFATVTVTFGSSGQSTETPFSSINLTADNDQAYADASESEVIDSIVYHLSGVVYVLKNPVVYLFKQRTIARRAGWIGFSPPAYDSELPNPAHQKFIIPQAPRYASLTWSHSFSQPTGSVVYTGTWNWSSDGFIQTPTTTAARSGIEPIEGSTLGLIFDPLAIWTANAVGSNLGPYLRILLGGDSSGDTATSVTRTSSTGDGGFPDLGSTIYKATDPSVVACGTSQTDWRRRLYADLVSSGFYNIVLHPGEESVIFSMDATGVGQGMAYIPHVFVLAELPASAVGTVAALGGPGAIGNTPGVTTTNSSNTNNTSGGYSGLGPNPAGGALGPNPAGGNLGLNPAGGNLGFNSSGGNLGFNPAGGDLGFNPAGGNLGPTPAGGNLGFNSAGGDLGINPAGGNLGFNPAGGGLGFNPSGGGLGFDSGGGNLGFNPAGGSLGSSSGISSSGGLGGPAYNL